MQTYAKDLFQLQSELVDGKVDMAVSKAIDQVIFRIDTFEDKVSTRLSSLETAVEKRFSAIENRLVAVETKLGMVNEREKEIRNKIVEYAFRAGYALGGVVIAYLWFHLQALSH